MTNQIGNGKLVIVSGPSGVGKTTICNEVIEKLENVVIIVSVTTRTQSESEIDGKDYFFISKEDFEKQIEQEQLLEYAEVFGNLYGTPKDKVEQALSDGKTVILEIDVQGGKQVKAFYPQAIMIFILPPGEKDLVRRMEKRARGEDSHAAKQRLGEADAEIATAWQYYEHMVINDNLHHAVDEITEIINSTIA